MTLEQYSEAQQIINKISHFYRLKRIASADEMEGKRNVVGIAHVLEELGIGDTLDEIGKTIEQDLDKRIKELEKQLELI